MTRWTGHVILSSRIGVQDGGRVMSAASPIEVDSENRIPIIDVAPFLAGEPGAATTLADQITRTCLDTGFLVITNHRVPHPIIDRAFAAAAAFFALGDAQKLALKVGGENIGYLPYGGQPVRTSTVHRNTKPNYSESFAPVFRNDRQQSTKRPRGSDPGGVS
jgi:isopenicillin N synthase-like dioxygenase